MNLYIVLVILIFLWLLIRYLQKLQKIDPVIYKSKSVYSDHAIVPEKPFYSKKYLLTGKMDKILEIDGKKIPLEIKNTRRPREPYMSHVMQLMSYCLLMEEHYRKRPEYGILQYAQGEPFIVPYSDEKKSKVIGVIKKMQAFIKEQKVDAS